MAAEQGYPGDVAYCASKDGMNGPSEALAVEGKPYGVRAFAVRPVATETRCGRGRRPTWCGPA